MAKFTPYGIINRPLLMVRDLLMLPKEAPQMAERAIDASRAKYPDSQQWMGEGDAYRHMAWQAMLTQKYGPVIAKILGSSHELGFGGPLGRPEQTAREEKMDLYNNSVGREIGNQTSNLDDMMKALDAAIEYRKADYLDKVQREAYRKVLSKQQEEEQPY